MLSFLHTLPNVCLEVLSMALFAGPAIWLNDNLKRRRAKSFRMDRESLARFG